MKHSLHFETLQVHGGLHRSKARDTPQPSSTPIYQSAAFLFDDSDHAASLFALKEFGFIYSRLTNPTVNALQERIALLEQGTGSAVTASGMSAIQLAIITLAKSGENIVSDRRLYGGTITLFRTWLSRCGIDIRFVNMDDKDEIHKACDEKTRAMFAETIGNPMLNILDLESVAHIAHEHGVPLLVDNTFGGLGFFCAPFAHGVDLTIHSLTKWAGGHGTSLGGAVVDAGSFDFGSGKHSLFEEANSEGVIFAKHFGKSSQFNCAFALMIQARTLRSLGPAISPQNAFQIMQGIETLSLRLERISANSLALAKWLQAHPAVEKVNYPGLPDSRQHEHAKKYLQRGFGGVLTFNPKGGLEHGKKFIASLQLVSHLANVGDCKTLAIQPAATTHAQLSKDELQQAGVEPNQIRISVGIEHIDDIIADMDQALASSTHMK